MFLTQSIGKFRVSACILREAKPSRWKNSPRHWAYTNADDWGCHGVPDCCFTPMIWYDAKSYFCIHIYIYIFTHTYIHSYLWKYIDADVPVTCATMRAHLCALIFVTVLSGPGPASWCLYTMDSKDMSRTACCHQDLKPRFHEVTLTYPMLVTNSDWCTSWK